MELVDTDYANYVPVFSLTYFRYIYVHIYLLLLFCVYHCNCHSSLWSLHTTYADGWQVQLISVLTETTGQLWNCSQIEFLILKLLLCTVFALIIKRAPCWSKPWPPLLITFITQTLTLILDPVFELWIKGQRASYMHICDQSYSIFDVTQ